jgi:phospholipid/cholesterol/gamma-HCH transport system ATP-binding protein
MASAYHIADRIAMIYEGEIIALGTVKEIKKSKDPRVTAFLHGIHMEKEEDEE